MRDVDFDGWMRVGLRKRGSWQNEEPPAHTARVHELVTLHLKLREPNFYINYDSAEIPRVLNKGTSKVCDR